MLINRLLRWTVLVAILAAFAPAPASAQIGRFIKKKLKQTIEQAMVESVAPGETPVARSGPAAPLAGPAFDESVIEMTPEVLENFEKGLVAEIAARMAAAPELAKILSFGDYNPCINRLKASAEGAEAYRATQTEYQLERDRAKAKWDALQLASCGPYPGVAYKYRQQLADKQAEAVRRASGLTDRQYDILKERVIPFCTLGPSTVGHTVAHVAQGGAFLVYSSKELMALGARCAKLSFSLKGVA